VSEKLKFLCNLERGFNIMFENLDNQAMLEAYYEAIRLNLDIDFISILKEEIDKRGIYTKLIEVQFNNRSI
jgi:hypothetical protein